MVCIKNILVTGRMYKNLQQTLAHTVTSQQLRFVAEDSVCADDLAWADAFVGFRPTPYFELRGLQWVHALGAGVDAFLYKRTWREDVLLTRTTGPFGKKISEYCLGYILRHTQLHRTYGQQQRDKRWHVHVPESLTAQKVVIYGTGDIAQEIARVLHMFGVTVYGVSRGGTAAPHFQDVYALGKEREQLRDANWVISTLPLTEQTVNIFDHSFFQSLYGAHFINVGRGATVDEGALLRALRLGNVQEAILDVFTEEPLSATSPFWEMPNVTITPHISAITSIDEAAAGFLETLSQLEEGKIPLNRVDVKRGY